jgi:putative nucleotidyltransferase-like protein
VQEQLLVAALGDPSESVRAWRGVQPEFSLDELEPGSFELLPLVYRNLSSSGYEDALLPRLKGIYRRTWVKNNLLLERTRDIAEALRETGIRALFLEGAALALRYYPDLGLRPTSFIHLLVTEAEEAKAFMQLQRAGWSDRPDSGAHAGWRFLFDGGGNICVLRTSVAFDFVAPEDRALTPAPLWEAAERQEVAGTEILVPTPTAALLGIVVSGARLGPVPSTQWLADAAMVLRGHEIDWERLLQVGIARGQALRLRHVFDYLLQLPVPDPPRDVRVRLDGAPVTRRQRLIYALSSGSFRGLGGVQETVAEHLAATGHESLARTAATFPGRLRDRWGLEHSWQLPFAAGRRAIRLVGAGGKRTA